MSNMRNKDKKVQTRKFNIEWQPSRKKICPVCGKSYEYSLKIIYNPDGTKICYHDDEVYNKPHFNLTDQRIIRNLKPNQVLAKKDGISFILEK